MTRENILPVALLSLFIAGTLSAFAAKSTPEKVTLAGSKINFSGSVVAAPCIVDNDSNTQVIDLGQVTTKSMVMKGDTSTAVPFSIKLTGCDLRSQDSTDPDKSVNYTKVAITFSGTTTGDASTLALSANGAGSSVAKNVGIQILQDNIALKVDGSAPAKTTTLFAGTNEIPFSAMYVATADGVTAGSANSSVDFRVTYE